MPSSRLFPALLLASASLGAAAVADPEPNLRASVSIVSDAPVDVMETGVQFPPIPPFPKPTKDGIGFKRKISQMEEGLGFFLSFSGGACEANDTYGDSSCQYQWGESIVANYTLQLGEKLDEGDVIKANLKVDHFIPFSFTCAVCGSDCVLKLPVPRLDLKWAFPTPDCPIDTNLIVDSFREDLGKSSPTDGIPVHVEGGVHVVRENGDIAAAFSVSVDLK